MLKELLFTSYHPEVETVHVGVFPAHGRYFMKEMTTKSNGVFEVELDLPLGKSYYHYFLNGDFQNPVRATNNKDTELIHDRVPLMMESSIFCPLEFAPQERYLTAIGEDFWELRALTHHGWIKKVSLLTEQGTFPLVCNYEHKNRKYWSLRFKPSEVGSVFILRFGDDFQIRYLHQGGRIRPRADFKYGFSLKLSTLRRLQNKETSGATGYQVFPDTFCRSGSGPDQSSAGDPLHSWGSAPQYYRYFGGDLLGIKSKLPYLKELGIDFIYLNPIFTAGSPHRYDSIDYREIDPLLGDLEDFKQLVEAVHAQGMKLILDVALNHCSLRFAPFKDVLEKQEASIYRNWFFIQSYPLALERPSSYLSWGNYKDLPLLNIEHPEVRTYLLDTLKYWTENFAIDGWRLDVSTEIEETFIREIAQNLRAIKPEIMLVGECWHHVNGRRVVKKGKLNGLTNFSLYWNAFMPFFVREQISVERLAESLISNTWSTDSLTLGASWIFLSNHDTPRFYSLIAKKEWYPLAFALLYALPGKPVLYYGEEIAMEGLHDPDNRACMDWERVANQKKHFQQYLFQLNSLRQRFQALLEQGSLSIVLADTDRELLAVQRQDHNHTLVFLFNFGKQEQLLSAEEWLEKGALIEQLIPPEPISTAKLLLRPFSFRIFSITSPI